MAKGAALFLAVTTTVTAQQATAPVAPKFEVVSIRQVPANAPPLIRETTFTAVLPGGQFVDPRIPLGVMIAFAYDVRDYKRLVGLPKWADEQAYAVAAKPGDGFPLLPPAENVRQVRLMMQAMLADRCHLRLHTESRQERVLKLQVTKSGFKIKPVDPPVPPAKSSPVVGAIGNDSGRMIGNKSTMEGMARALGVFLKQHVIDDTGLEGYYDFDVKWSDPGAPGSSPHGGGFGAEAEALLMSALQDRFGLRLVPAMGSVTYWVVDRVERPTEN